MSFQIVLYCSFSLPPEAVPEMVVMLTAAGRSMLPSLNRVSPTTESAPSTTMYEVVSKPNTEMRKQKIDTSRVCFGKIIFYKTAIKDLR